MTVSLKTAVVIVCLVGTLGQGAASGETALVRSVREDVPSMQPARYFAYPDFLAVLRGAEYVNTLYVEELFAGIHAELERAVAYVQSVEAEYARIYAEQQRAHVQPRITVGSGSGGGGGGSCGGATNGADQFIHRESGGNPNVVNSSSGAYGCYQIMPYVWNANCSDLGAEQGSSASAQAACASRLPLSAWAG